jgi:hypothetical protein
MFKHVLATAIWFLAAWELGSAISLIPGLDNELLAPALALIAASIVALDPFHSFRGGSSRATPRNSLSAAGRGQTS